MGMIMDQKVVYKCPAGQEMVEGECFTPYVYYCDNRKQDIRTQEPVKGK
jgi:hypothetical protein